MTNNYFSEEYLMNTVSRFWKKFVAEEFSYGNAVAAGIWGMWLWQYLLPKAKL